MKRDEYTGVKRKRSIAWEDVEKYLKRYVGEIYSIAEDNEIIYIGYWKLNY